MYNDKKINLYKLIIDHLLTIIPIAINNCLFRSIINHQQKSYIEYIKNKIFKKLVPDLF